MQQREPIDVTTLDHKTRRQVLRAGLLAVGGSVAAIADAGAQQKLEPKVVQYQSTPKDGNKCSMCVNFEAPSACKIVSGTIDPNGWCIAYAPKQS
jgi:hypothetical protein